MVDLANYSNLYTKIIGFDNILTNTICIDFPTLITLFLSGLNLPK